MLTQLAVIHIVLVCCFIASVHCCSCRTDVPFSTNFNDANYVFIGTAIHSKLNRTALNLRVVFQVEEAFKGPLSVGQNVTINTNIVSAACGVPIRTGERWQIWAYGNEERLATNLCSPTTRNVNQNIDDLRQHASSVSCNRRPIKTLLLVLIFSLLPSFLFNH